MPLYEYRCRSCGHVLEVIQKFSDRPIRKCRECSGRLEKLVSRSSFTLKGGGWYSDDYGKTSKRTAGGEKSDSGDSKSTPKKDKGSSAKGCSAADCGC